MLAWGQRTPLLRGVKDPRQIWLRAGATATGSWELLIGSGRVSRSCLDALQCPLCFRTGGLAGFSRGGVREEGTFSRVGGGAGELRASTIQASFRDETDEVPAPVQLMFC